MSVIAWDGKSLAADKAATCGQTITATTKIRRIEGGEIVAWTGSADAGLMLLQWYEEGADVTRWPQIQKTDDWARLIIASANGVRYYERLPVVQWVEPPFAAWGSGADSALGALAMGATAKRAVEIASQFNAFCGLGVDVFTVDRQRVTRRRRVTSGK